MVDAVIMAEGKCAAPDARSTTRGQSIIVRSGREAAIVERYREACGGLLLSPPQKAAWIAAWQNATRAELIVAELRHDDHVSMVMALEVLDRRPLRLARFPGGSHANGNFPAIDPGSPPSHDAVVRLVRAVAQARPDIDMLALERQIPVLSGHPNPMLALGYIASSDVALAADLSGGFDALLGRLNGKRKRKKHRSQARKFDAAGGYRHLRARTPEEVDRFLDAFFSMRAERLAHAGVPNAFADAGTQAALRSLFSACCAMDPPPFVLHALEVGGRLRAVSGSSRREDAIVCEFTGFANDEMADAAPGDFLFFENIRAACDDGCALYDFSVGDERYKREWCGIETRPLDIVVPLTMKGRIAAGAWRSLAASKRGLKSSPLAMRAIRRLRGTLDRKAEAERR